MDQGRQTETAAAVQPVIERLVDEVTRSGISMRLLSSAHAYLRAAENAHVWVDPACAQQDGGFKTSRFWIEFADTAQNTLAVGSGRILESADIARDIAHGELWYPGGFADHCALQALELAEPSRLIAGTISYLQLAVSDNAEWVQDNVVSLSLLLQALAMRHHKADFLLQMTVNAPSVRGVPLLAGSYAREDFLMCNFFPPAETRATLSLHHSSTAEFLALTSLEHAPQASVKTAMAMGL